MRARSWSEGRRVALRWGIVVGALLLHAMPVAAHPLVDEAFQRADQADFQGAFDAIGRAEAATDLDRNDVIRLEEVRALVHSAFGDDDALDRDLSRLAALDPDHVLGDTVPPGIRRRFDEVRANVEPPSLRAGAVARRGAYRITVELLREDFDLVRSFRIHTRAVDGDWVLYRRMRAEPAGDQLDIPAPPDSRLEYYAEAIGPGGARLWSAGSRDRPRSIGVLAPPALDGAHPGGHAPPGDAATAGGSSGWLFVGLGAAALLIAGAIVAILVATSPEPGDLTHIGGPTASLPDR